MKAIYFLLIALLFSCVERDRRWHYPSPEECGSRADLSAIASEVIAIPLETPGKSPLREIKQVKKDGTHLFLVSDRKLYHYSKSGKFLNSVDSPDDSLYVRDYALDPEQQRLMILDYRQYIHYYTYSGRYIDSRYAGKAPWNTLYQLTYFDKHLWATAETLRPDPDDPSHLRIEKWLYRFDPSLHHFEGTPIEKVDLDRPDYSNSCRLEMAVINNKVYVHAPTLQPGYLLRDSLYLLNNGLLETPPARPVRLFPFQLHRRFLLASYYNPTEPELNYTFCFDREKRDSYLLEKGFRDDFYLSGYVPDMRPLNLSSDEYYYCKKSGELHPQLPATGDETPVLFILKLKGRSV